MVVVESGGRTYQFGDNERVEVIKRDWHRTKPTLEHTHIPAFMLANENWFVASIDPLELVKVETKRLIQEQSCPST